MKEQDRMPLIHRINRHPFGRLWFVGFPLIIAYRIFVTKDCPWWAGSLLALTLSSTLLIIDFVYGKTLLLKELLEAE